MSPTPRQIDRVGEHDVRVQWNDGHDSVFLARALRLACPCAHCVDESSGAPSLNPAAVPLDVRPLRIGAVGRYGLELKWSDGHETGIYAFELLRALCPCAACVAPAAPAVDARPASFPLPVLGNPGPVRAGAEHGLPPLVAGEPISPQRTMEEIFAFYPGAARALFLRYHLGGCGSCAFPLDAPLADLCGHHGLDCAEVASVIAASAEFEQQLRIKPKDLAALLAGPQRVRLLDARTPEEWIAARIPGALHLTDERVEGIVQSWSRDTPMVFYCHQGKDSPVTADYFIGHGFTHVRVLEGGIDAWSLEVDPSVRRYQLEYPPPPPGIPSTHTQALGQ